jgi:hypothetical protein
MSFNVFSLDSAKHLFYMELVKQFIDKGYPSPTNYVNVMGTIDDAALVAVPSTDGNRSQYVLDNSGRQSKLFYVIKKAVINPLGMTDWVTYFLMYTKKWYKNWASEDNMDIKKYYKKEGITFRAPHKLFRYPNTSPYMSALAVITTEPRTSINYCKISDLCMDLTKNVDIYRTFKDQQGIEKGGAPKSIFSEKDCFV